MRYFYCLLFAITIFIGCSKDDNAPQNNNELEAQIMFTRSGMRAGSDLYYNEVHFYYPRTINATINVSIQFSLETKDTVVVGIIEPNYTSKPSGFGDGKLIVGISKTFNLATLSKATKAELIKVTCDDPKYTFKILRSLNEVYQSDDNQ